MCCIELKVMGSLLRSSNRWKMMAHKGSLERADPTSSRSMIDASFALEVAFSFPYPARTRSRFLTWKRARSTSAKRISFYCKVFPPARVASQFSCSHPHAGRWCSITPTAQQLLESLPSEVSVDPSAGMISVKGLLFCENRLVRVGFLLDFCRFLGELFCLAIHLLPRCGIRDGFILQL